jgi:hypothetical protein
MAFALVLSAPAALGLLGERGAMESVPDEAGFAEDCRPAISNMWRVALSEVQARRVPDGLKRREKIDAWSMPRRSSAMRAQFAVAKTRMSVPCGLLSVSETIPYERSCMRLHIPFHLPLPAAPRLDS